jgi:glycosyltransferase involved in cell wall biosynthesis
MASRMPVVVSNTLEFAGKIASAEAGFAVERDPERFAAKILELLENPKLRHRMGENGALLAKRYSLEDTAVKVERAIECILRRRPLPTDLTRS